MKKRVSKEVLLAIITALSICIYITSIFMSFDMYNGGILKAAILLGIIAIISLIGVIIGFLILRESYKVPLTLIHIINTILFIVCVIMFIRFSTATLGLIILL